MPPLITLLELETRVASDPLLEDEVDWSDALDSLEEENEEDKDTDEDEDTDTDE
jgi:hypothetical protein